MDTGQGLVLITGCSHPGVSEIAKRAKEQLGRDVCMVCGGMHLLQMSDGQISEVVRELKSLGVQKIGVTHCTGEKATGLFKQAFGEGFVELGVGRVLQLGKAKTYANAVGEPPIQVGDPFVLQHGDRVVNIDRLYYDEERTLKIKGPTRSPQPMPSGAVDIPPDESTSPPTEPR